MSEDEVRTQKEGRISMPMKDRIILGPLDKYEKYSKHINKCNSL
jgi:hypothetical protein